MSFVTGLKCRECSRPYPKRPLAGCEACFGPLEVDYDYQRIREVVSREVFAARPRTLWRYHELLPLDGAPRVGRTSGGTPLMRAERLGEALGLRRLYVKNDGVCSPTLSFKDRVTGVAINKAMEFGFEAVGCASTGNLANSVAATAAAAGLPAYILVPRDLEPAKIRGTSIYGARVVAVEGHYDLVNRLCTQIAEAYPWGMVNVNLRPYYAEGSKTFAFEIADDLGWVAPDAVVVPMAGGSLISKIHKGFQELVRIGLLPEAPVRLYGAQASGCNPIVRAIQQGTQDIVPVRPATVAKSLAIGSPADGYHAAGLIAKTGGWGEDVSDGELLDGIRLLAETEGILSETAGGVTVAVARKLARQGRLRPDETVVLALTGNGLKTLDAVDLPSPPVIAPRLEAFAELVDGVAAGR